MASTATLSNLDAAKSRYFNDVGYRARVDALVAEAEASVLAAVPETDTAGRDSSYPVLSNHERRAVFITVATLAMYLKGDVPELPPRLAGQGRAAGG